MLPGSGRIARPRLPRRPRRLLAILAAAWICGGLIQAFGYVNYYSQHRGFAVLHRSRGVRAGHAVWEHFYSAALGREADYLVYLPTGYTPSRRYPAYYLLHGLPGRPQAFIRIASIDVRLDDLIAAHEVRPMILVFPDGRIGGSTMSDSEWANTSAGRYESYVIDVVHDLDRRLPTIADRQARVIGGYSAGGYGALNITLHHPAVFGSVQVWSGYFRQTRSGVFARATPQELAANSPSRYVPRLHRALVRDPLRVFLFCGRGDHNRVLVAPMAAELRAAGARATFAIYPGGHDWGLWHARLNQMLRQASRDFTAPLRPASHPRRRASRSAGPPHRRRVHRRRAHHHSVVLERFVFARSPRRTAPSVVELLGLLLAVLSAATINLGFLLQHRGLRSPASGDLRALARALLRSRAWLAGQAVGSAGFAVQIVAVALAPLALVQAFAAGGMALSVPIASRFFGHRIERRVAVAVIGVAAALAVLPLGLSGAGDRFHPPVLLVVLATGALAAAALSGVRTPIARAVAGGLFYGVADSAIKAIAVRWSGHGAGALFSGWMLVALAATVCGFLAFQAALRSGSAIAAISLVNVFATLVSVGSGVVAFGESLGDGGLLAGGHVAAIALVLACVPALASAQLGLVDGDGDARGPHRSGPPTGDGTADEQDQRLDPWPVTGAAGAEHLSDRDVASDRVGLLREEPQQRRAEQARERGSRNPRDAPEAYSSHQAGR